ncbi:MAG: tRNA pseudouridine(38-40) synthase TruA [Deltaproteobacteria bacterium]|nr:tRNA pseudouridine(38-40) synthase TruA [Deltaproteobacteria bacterium]
MSLDAAIDPRRNLKLTLEYDGTGLAGWQRQKDRPSVQGRLEEALNRLTGEKVIVIAAGRTDAGVHASGQVAHFRTASRLTLEEIQRGGNALLPAQIAIVSVEEAAPDFHARYHAMSKTYTYDLYTHPVRPVRFRNYSWHVPAELDLAAMDRALKCLVGEHDFASFRSVGSTPKTTVRRILTADISTLPGDRIRITLQGTGFLRHMVRAIVGTLVKVGRSKMSPAEFEAVLRARDRSAAGVTAPAQGLCLRAVHY